MVAQVRVMDWSELSKKEQEEYKYYHWSYFLEIIWPNGDRQLECDGMEPEDATFVRDLKWVKSALERMRDGW